MKKLAALVLALVMVLAMVSVAFAENAATTNTPSITITPQNPDTVTGVAIDYVAYRILEASIGTNPVVDAADGSTTTHGAVAYYVTTAERKAELEETNLFNITQVGSENKWFVELKSSSTTAEQLVAAFSASTFDLTKFQSVSFNKTATESNAQSGEVAPGYYYITSTLGSKIALQTLTEVTINEKNTYTTDNKTIPVDDVNSEIGQTIKYTLTVNVPVTANKQIVLTDTMSKGLTFKEIVSQDPIIGTVSNVEAAENGATKFTITYTEDQIKGLVSGKTDAQTITVEVAVIVNEEAEIQTDIPNTLDLKYGNVYDATPKTVITKTYDWTFDKKDQDGTMLTGAEFKLTKATANTKDSTTGWIGLVAETVGQTYHIATPKEISDANVTVIDTIVTDGHTVTIKGLDLDQDYFLVETKAPTGYNILNDHVVVEKNQAQTDFVHKDVVNAKGTELPSTGGIGTTIFYAVGGLMVLGAAIILVSRRKAEAR